MPTTRLDLAVHAHRTTLNKQLRFTTGAGSTRDFQKGAQRHQPFDGDLVQLLKRIGMMR